MPKVNFQNAQATGFALNNNQNQAQSTETLKPNPAQPPKGLISIPPSVMGLVP
jgi:hypothetical protein